MASNMNLHLSTNYYQQIILYLLVTIIMIDVIVIFRCNLKCVIRDIVIIKYFKNDHIVL